MTAPRTARTVAAEVLAEVLKTDRFAKDVLDKALRSSGLSLADRRLCTELCYGALRWHGPLSTSIRRALDKPGRKLDAKVLPHLLIAAYQLHHLAERIPARAAVHEAVQAVKTVRPGLAGFANAVLRNLGSAPHDMLGPDPDEPALAAAYGVPLLLVGAVTAGLSGAARVEAVAGLNARPRRGIAWLSAAPPEGTGLVPHAFVEGAYLAEHLEADVVAAIEDGRALVQDPGSRAVVNLCAAQPGHAVLDMCAAPGTKTRGLWAAVAPTGRVVAADVNARRARRIADHVRPGDNIEVVVGDATVPPEGEGDAVAAYDVVLIDAPCTGLGTTRRRPEIKLRRTEAEPRLLEVQSRLLDAGAERVRPGGVLVYAVCSPLPEEGSAQIEAFLSRRPDFVREPASSVLPGLPKHAQDAAGQLQLRPSSHDADAFFAVRLRRGAP